MKYKNIYGEDFKFDEDFYWTFCPVCGSDDITGSGEFDELLGKDRVSIKCNNCEWTFTLFVNHRGKNNFEVRKDMIDCEICKKEMEDD